MRPTLKLVHRDHAQDFVQRRLAGQHAAQPHLPEGLHALLDGDLLQGAGGKLLQDRHHPLRLNRRLGISALLQTVTLIGEPLPPGLETFTHFADFLSTVWGIDASQLPSPKWQERLI